MLLTAASVLALVAAGSLSAAAQVQTYSNTTPLVVPNVVQTGPSPNTNNPPDFVLSNSAFTPGLVGIIDSADVKSLANADATVRGPNPGDPVSVSQTNTGTSAGAIVQLNQNDQDFDIEAIASSGPIDVTNSLITGGTIALSRATANAAVESVVTQRNTNAGVDNTGPTNQNVTQSNDNDGDFDVDASATSGAVNVSSTGMLMSR